MPLPATHVIDLSHWNEIPSSLEAAAAAGVVGVIHKASEGTSYVDKKVSARWYLAKDAGMLWGLYHFLLAGKIEQQANHFCDLARQYGDENTLLALDWEIPKDSPTAPIGDAIAWLDAVEKQMGRRPIIYSGNVIKEAVGGKRHDKLNEDNYKLWIAQFPKDPVNTPSPTLPTGWSKYWLWQWSEKGTVAGVTPPTDCNQADDLTEVLRTWSGGEEPMPAPPPPEPPEPGLDHGIGWAVAQLVGGQKVAREGWNGKGMWLFYADRPGDNWQPFVAMHTVQGTDVPWLCSQTDLLAQDWRLV